MALVQALLVRSLVARFWDEPYRGALVRWGTELHDRFLLPHYVRRRHRRRGRRPARPRLRLRPRVARAVPRVPLPAPRRGRHRRRAPRAAQRHRAVARARRGDRPRTRHGPLRRLVGRAAPGRRRRARPRPPRGDLQRRAGAAAARPAGAGAPVAGVRYRAWQPPSALHPTIGVHSPLVFDLVDRWNGRSLGGCTYHVVAPRRPVLRDVPGQRQRGRGPPGQPLRAHGHTPGARRRRPARPAIGRRAIRDPRIPSDPRPPAAPRSADR